MLAKNEAADLPERSQGMVQTFCLATLAAIEEKTFATQESQLTCSHPVSNMLGFLFRLVFTLFFV
jgi:hypothetical protein